MGIKRNAWRDDDYKKHFRIQSYVPMREQTIMAFVHVQVMWRRIDPEGDSATECLP